MDTVDIYYLTALQNLLFLLNNLRYEVEDAHIFLFNNIEELEDDIIAARNEFDSPTFYYCAGRAVEAGIHNYFEFEDEAFKRTSIEIYNRFEAFLTRVEDNQ